MRHTTWLRAAAGAALVLLICLATLPTATPSHAENGHFDVAATLTPSNFVPGAARGITTNVTIPSGDLNGGGAMLFEPAAVTITPGCNIPGGRDLNNDGDALDPGETTVCLASGDSAGTQTSSVTLGLNNSACSLPIPVPHDLLNVALPNNELDPRASTNIAYVRPEGSLDRFGGWQLGSPPAPTGGMAPLDTDANGRAEGGSLPIQNYPSYLLDVFDPDGPVGAPPVLPIAVYGGLTSLAGNWIPVYFAQFEAGGLAAAFAGQEPHPFARAVAALGHVSQAVLGDPTATQVTPSQITDFCTPLVTSTQLNATVGGVNRATNPPAAGTHVSLLWQSSQRDLDNDGYENSLDTCPRIANVENPHSSAGPDNDTLDSACDPTPLVTVQDQDADGFQNGQDNCPLLPNPSQAEAEAGVSHAIAAFDGGPPRDSMGDDCDTGPAVSVTVNGIAYSITPGSTVANGHFHVAATVIPACYGNPPLDADGDGYCTAQDGSGGEPAPGNPLGSCGNPTPEQGGPAPFENCTVRHNQWATGSPYSAALNAFDTDRGGGDRAGPPDTGGIGTIPCPGGATDVCPENGFDSDWIEDYVGTDPAKACAQTSSINDEPYDPWIFDFDSNGATNLADVGLMGNHFNTFNNDANGGPGNKVGNVRFDLNADGQVNGADLSYLGPVFSKFCRRVDGTVGPLQ